MTIIIRGKVIHHNDCFYCQHVRFDLIPSTGRTVKARERETCSFTGATIPPPLSSGQRWCEKYQQKGCNCDQCAIEIPKDENHGQYK
jgi:hypothetical protein